jgi:hypothetical protein
MWVFYGGVGVMPGDTQPATLYKQVEAGVGVNEWTTEALAGGGDPHPTTNNFPGATPAKIRNYPDTLSIDANGIIKGVEVYEGSERLAIAGPHMYAHINANTTTRTNGAWVDVASWTVDDPVSGGLITHNAGTGVFTVPIAGRYLITCILSYGDGTTGVRGVTYVINGTSRASVIAAATSSFQGVAQASLGYRLAAGATIKIQSYANQGSAIVLRGDANGNYSNLQITYQGR